MGWAFVWMMVGLKIPIVALGLIVYWAWRSEPDPGSDESDGGGEPRHPRAPRPRPSRRGPHHGDAAPAPARMRRPAGPSRRPAPGRL
jgi:hypothetical protein